MRLLFATSIKTWGGGEEWMLSAALGLAERGHDVALAARPKSAILERARRTTLSSFEVPFRADLDVGSILKIRSLCRSRRVELVCVNMDRTLRVAGLGAKLAGVANVVPRRGSEFPLKDGWLYRLTYQHLVSAMIVNSRTTLETLTRNIRWRPRGPLHVLLNGIDLRRFDAPRPREEVREELGLAPEDLVLATVGELTTRKNAALILETLPELSREFRIRWLVIGEGAERSTLETRARALGVSEFVHFVGFRQDIPDLLHASDLLVHAATVEGFGYVVAEAMAASLPVVATNASSLPEIVEVGETGLLFESEDADGLRDAIRIYLEDRTLRERHGRAGRARVESSFSFERRLDELEEIFSEAIQSSSHGESR